MDGLSVLEKLVNEAANSVSKRGYINYCGVALIAENKRGVTFFYTASSAQELSAGYAITLLDEAYREYTNCWQLGLSDRARQVLQRYGIFELSELGSQLLNVNSAEWQARQNCGKRGYEEIKSHFDKFKGVAI